MRHLPVCAVGQHVSNILILRRCRGGAMPPLAPAILQEVVGKENEEEEHPEREAGDRGTDTCL